MVIEYINDLSREIERVITRRGQTFEQMETELLETQFYLMGHITERIPDESDVFAVRAQGTVRNAAWFKLRRVVRELITESVAAKEVLTRND